MSKDCSLLSNKEAGDIDTREILLNLFIWESFFSLFAMKNLKNCLRYL